MKSITFEGRPSWFMIIWMWLILFNEIKDNWSDLNKTDYNWSKTKLIWMWLMIIEVVWIRLIIIWMWLILLNETNDNWSDLNKTWLQLKKYQVDWLQFECNWYFWMKLMIIEVRPSWLITIWM